ncbi:MAG: hypothetical protein ACOC5T_03050 [Elusimicrobiota bacterium]
MKTICVCKFCGGHSSEEASLEFNFRDGKIYYICPDCKKPNIMVMKIKKEAKPLPKIRPMR